ncbi:hypothetical protein ACXWR7_11910, partial [Streptococcus pyogenes]
PLFFLLLSFPSLLPFSPSFLPLLFLFFSLFLLPFFSFLPSSPLSPLLSSPLSPLLFSSFPFPSSSFSPLSLLPPFFPLSLSL